MNYSESTRGFYLQTEGTKNADFLPAEKKAAANYD
jgi:hypothetical protein